MNVSPRLICDMVQHLIFWMLGKECTVKTGTVHNVLSGLHVRLHVFLDLLDSKRTRYRSVLVHRKIARAGEIVWAFLLQNIGVRRATERPELQVDEGALRVDGVHDLQRAKGQYTIQQAGSER